MVRSDSVALTDGGSACTVLAGAYTAFDHEGEKPFWKLQRALIPNSGTAPWTPKQKYYKQPVE